MSVQIYRSQPNPEEKEEEIKFLHFLISCNFALNL